MIIVRSFVLKIQYLGIPPNILLIPGLVHYAVYVWMSVPWIALNLLIKINDINNTIGFDPGHGGQINLQIVKSALITFF